MTERSVAEIDAVIVDIERQKAALEQTMRELKTERGEAILRETPPHPLMGKKVKRWIKSYSFSEPRTQRGRVFQNDKPHSLYVGGRGIRPGEFFVKSHSGKTVYDMKTGARVGEWEIDE